MLALLLIAGLLQSSPAPITVSAAVSLTEALEEAAKAFGAAGGARVVFNFGGSNALARQIVNGAPVDVFVSADETQMDVVEKAGLVAEGTRVPIGGQPARAGGRFGERGEIGRPISAPRTSGASRSAIRRRCRPVSMRGSISSASGSGRGWSRRWCRPPTCARR